jgi:hypothetical protein
MEKFALNDDQKVELMRICGKGSEQMEEMVGMVIDSDGPGTRLFQHKFVANLEYHIRIMSSTLR